MVELVLENESDWLWCYIFLVFTVYFTIKLLNKIKAKLIMAI